MDKKYSNYFIKLGKKCIDKEDINGLNDLYNSIRDVIYENKDYGINFPDIYMKIFYYACKKSKKKCIRHMMQIYFDKFDDFTKIALRQSFFYGKFLIKNNEVKKWYSYNIIPLIKTK